MKIIESREALEELLRERKGAKPSSKLKEIVSSIIKSVMKEGDAAVCEYTKEFDKCSLSPSKLKVSKREIDNAACSKELESAIKNAAVAIRAFHEKQLRSPWRDKGPYGGEFGEVYRPVERAGVYVPAGTAPLVSSVLMSVIPAQVAGVKSICVATPCDSEGKVNPGILAACKLLNVKELYRGHGPSLVAAMCLGTRAIPKVDVIAGPGSAAVTEMKRQLFGAVNVDLIAGPSESLIIADESADPRIVAADIMSQAEHHGSKTYVVATSRKLAEAVFAEVRSLNKGELAGAVEKAGLDNMHAVVVKDLKEAAAVSNAIAPEHLQIITENDEKVLSLIKNAGAVFLGKWTPVPMGDFAFGPSHVLPTGAAAAFMSGLSTATFLKRMSVMKADEEGFANMSKTMETFARCEKLPAHGFTSTVRKEKKK